MTKSIEFMDFWKTMNDVLQSRGLPELRYGEAKDWFNSTPDVTVSFWRKGAKDLQQEARA